MRLLTTGLTRWGLLATGLALAGTLLASRLWGGALFSPGPLSAEGDGARLGGVRSHAELETRCEACHASLGATTPTSARCLHCHTDIQPELGDSTTLHGVLGDARACLLCHTEHAGRSGNLTRIGDGTVHQRFGFALTAHQRTGAGKSFDCRDCHEATTWTFAADRCVSCHRDYQLDFVTKHAAVWGEDCRACHDGVDRFSPGRFDHDSTRYGLTGAHRRVSCAGCHPTARALAGFTEAPTTCQGCHAADDKHKGAFGEGCANCHGTDRWDDARLSGSPEVHEKLGFSLDAHQRTASGAAFACKDCHTGGSYRNARTSCADCHREEEPKFMAAHIAAFGDGCLACHDGKDRYGARQFSHDTTSMPLTGAHQRIPCTDCHAGARTPADFSRGATECATCHQKEDRHRGRLGTDCGACHNTRTWEGARFDHARTTSACVSCHRNDDRHGGRLGTDCAACHNTRSWEGAGLRHSFFPLDHGGRGTIACRTCHADAPNYKTYTCYGCHEHNRDRVLRQHAEEGTPRDIDNCVRCHRGGGGHEGGEGGDDD